MKTFKEFLDKVMVVHTKYPKGQEILNRIKKGALKPGKYVVFLYKRSIVSSSGVDYGFGWHKKRVLTNKQIEKDIKLGKLPPKDYHVFTIETEKDNLTNFQQFIDRGRGGYR